MVEWNEEFEEKARKMLEDKDYRKELLEPLWEKEEENGSKIDNGKIAVDDYEDFAGQCLADIFDGIPGPSGDEIGEQKSKTSGGKGNLDFSQVIDEMEFAIKALLNRYK